jgi:hypothetical protein
MPRLPWALQSYKHRNLPISAQQIINLFPEQEPRDAAAPVVLLPTAGTRVFTTLPTGPIRGRWVLGALLYVVAGGFLYSVDVAGTITTLGGIPGTEPVDIDDNGAQMGIAVPENGQLFFYTPATSTLAQVTDADFVGAVSIACLGGYTICVRPDSNVFAWSAVGDMAAWDALDFSSAEGASDNITRGKRVNEQLWLFGERTTEIWTTTASADAPFQRLNGAFIERGISARFSYASRLSVPYWLGDDRVVYRGDNTTPTRISTHAIEQAIGGYASVSDARAFIYEQEGHVFYCLTFPSGGDTWVFDAITQAWHERESEPVAYAGCWRCLDAGAFAGAVIAGDLVDGRLYVIDPVTYSEDGDEIIRVATGAPFISDGKRMMFSEVEAAMQTGVGLVSGQGSDPQVWLTFSDDGGQTWSYQRQAPMGRMGDYQARVRFQRLGSARNRVFRLQWSDPVGTALMAANVTYSVGSN